MKIKYLFLLFLCAFLNNGIAQTWTNYTSINTSTELSSNSLSRLVIDANDNVWIGAYHSGFNRFDGAAWSRYEQNLMPFIADEFGSVYLKGNNNKIFQNDGSEFLDIGIKAICMDFVGEDDFWYADYNGMYHRKDGVNIQSYDSNDDISGDYVTRIFYFEPDDIWVNSIQNGKCQDDPNAHYISMFNGSVWETIDTTIGGFLRSIVEFEGAKWLSTQNGLFEYKNGIFINHSLTNPSLIDTRVHKLFVSSINQLWIATDKGVAVYDGNSFHLFDTSQGLGNNSVVDIQETSTGEIWVSTFEDDWSAVNRYDGTSWTSFSHYDELTTKFGRNYIGIAIRDGDEVFVKIKNQGVARYKDGVWASYTANGLSSDRVEDINSDNDGAMWFATNTQVNSFSNSEWNKYVEELGKVEKVKSLHKDSNGNLYFSGSGVAVYDETNWSSIDEFNTSNAVSDVFDDNSGDLWVADNEVYQKMNGAWSLYSYQDFGFYFYPKSIHQLSSGEMWFGSGQHGIMTYDGSSWHNIKTENSNLYSNNVADLLEVAEGDIWIGCDRHRYYDSNFCTQIVVQGGIVRSQNGIFTRYDIGTEIGVTDILQDNLGRIWFGTESSGIYIYDSGAWFHLTDDNSELTTNNILKMYQDAQNNIWIGTYNKGVFKIENPDLLGLVLWNVDTTVKSLGVTPNPANSEIFFDSYQKGDVFITNMLGQVVMQESNFEGTQFDISTLSNGVYLMTLSSKGKMAQQKIVVGY